MKKLSFCTVTLLMLMSLTSSAFALSPPADECTTDADCPDIAECVRSPTTCVEWPSPGDEVCFSHMMCSTPPTVVCDSNADCSPDEVCTTDPETPVCDCAPSENGDDVCGCPAPETTCQPATPPPTECFSDAQCTPNEECALPENGIVCDCGPGDEDCVCNQPAPVGQCVPRTQQSECVSNSDCGPNETCSIPDSINCACPPNEENCACTQPNPIGQCIPSAEPGCKYNEECGPGEVCAVPVETSCNCGPDEDCLCAPSEGGQCVPAHNQCESDNDCGPGQTCATNEVECPVCPFVDEDGDGSNDINCSPCAPAEGICEDVSQACRSDRDCSRGESCYISQIECECPFIDDDNDGINDVACDCPQPQGACGPREPTQTACSSNSDCGEGQACELSTTTCSCGAPADGSEPDCNCPAVEHGQCVNVGSPEPKDPENKEPKEDGKFSWPQAENDADDDGDNEVAIGCSASNSNTPAPSGGLLMLMVFGMVGFVRRKMRK